MSGPAPARGPLNEAEIDRPPLTLTEAIFTMVLALDEAATDLDHYGNHRRANALCFRAARGRQALRAARA